MSGGYSVDTAEHKTPEMIKEVMEKFSVTKEIAEQIIADRNVFALEKMKKWTFNVKKRQKEKADYIYQLTRSLKRGHNSKIIIDEIEKKILELCVEG